MRAFTAREVSIVLADRRRSSRLRRTRSCAARRRAVSVLRRSRAAPCRASAYGTVFMGAFRVGWREPARFTRVSALDARQPERPRCRRPHGTIGRSSSEDSWSSRWQPFVLEEVPMGLLDDLLGGLAGQTAGRAHPQPMRAGGEGAGMSQVLIALVPVVLGMLANRGSQRSFAAGAGGGIADILGQALGGGARGTGAAGGLGGLLAQLQQAGFGEQADSWVGRGANKPISPDA